MPGENPDETQNTRLPTPSQDRPPSSSRASVPPSEPRPSRGSLSNLDAAIERPARLQMIVALMLGLVLVAIPLYLWRRPRAESIAVSRASADAGSMSTLTTTPPASVDVEPKPTLSDPRVLACMDPGPKKTPPDQCDHLADVEKALAKAIEDSMSCVPKDAGGGTIQYVADVSFKKKTIAVTAPKDARSIKNGKVAGACATMVKGKLHTVSLDAITHAHARYKIAITATYPGAAKP